ncbi:MAG: lipoate--protein ligase [Ruminococcaceae bacterium]|nr:lipoate--protein ligase [Oscillospiraceae bacterium]
MDIHYLETGSFDPAINLATEEFVLENRRSGDWLMLWQNDNTVVIGLNQNTVEEINPDFIEKHGTTVIRRNTGGGAVYHDLGNLNYSFFSDLGDAEELTMERFTLPVCTALKKMGVNAETSGRNDIIVEGKKVSGVAQRISGNRILHHGTLLFNSDTDLIAGALRVDSAKFKSKSSKSVKSRVANIVDFLPAPLTISEFKQKLLAALAGQGLVREVLADEEKQIVSSLADSKYRSFDWNYGRSPVCSLSCKKRFDCGTLEIKLSIDRTVISDLAFFGDFLAAEPCTPVKDALIGVPFERNAVTSAIANSFRQQMFGNISANEIIEIIFGESEL